MQKKQVKGVITHPKPHPSDEILAMWLLFKFGESQFPGIRQILKQAFALSKEVPPKTSNQIRFERPNAEEARRLEEEGWILLGVGGGMFDEHATKGADRKQGETCVTLVARHLGIHEMPELQQILKYSRSSDLQGQGNPFDVFVLAKLAQDYVADPWVPINMVFFPLNLKLAEQRAFHSAGADFKRATKTRFSSNGRELKLVVGETDNDQFGAYTRSEFGGYQDITVQKTPTGNVQIFVRKPSSQERREGKTPIDITDLARVIRMLEQQLSGVVSTDRRVLEAEQGPLGAENWYFPGWGLLNGSKTATEIQPTKLSLVQIGQTVQFALGDSFPADRVVQCSSGNCTRSSNPCPFDQFSLSRCWRVRGEK